MLLRESDTSRYRTYAYNPIREYRYLSFDGDIRELDDWLNGEVASGRATGGDIEEYVSGIGWVTLWRLV